MDSDEQNPFVPALSSDYRGARGKARRTPKTPTMALPRTLGSDRVDQSGDSRAGEPVILSRSDPDDRLGASQSVRIRNRLCTPSATDVTREEDRSIGRMGKCH